MNKAGCEGGQGPSLYILLRYPACPEGNGEPAKGLEQGSDMGGAAMQEDLSARLVLGYSRTAGISSQRAAAAPPRQGPLPTLQQPPQACSLLGHFL